MNRDRVLTNGTQPSGNCPHCGGSVVKAIVLGKLSYICNKCRRAGGWETRTKGVDNAIEGE